MDTSANTNGGGADRPSMQSADPPNKAAHGGDEALAAGQPNTEPDGPTPDTECEDSLHRPSATDRAGAAPLPNLALRAEASTPAGGDAARSTGNPRGSRDPGSHTRHAPVHGRGGNVTQRTQPRRQLFGVLQG